MPRIPVAERRDALIEAAIRVMERDGVAETTTRKIAAEASMPLASLHYAFASRGELIAAAARKLALEIVEVMRSSAKVDGDLPATLRRLLGGYVEFLRANPGRVLALYETQAAGVRMPELQQIAQNRVYRGKELVRYFLERAGAEAGVRYTHPVAEIGATLLESLDGFSLHWITVRDDFELDSSVELAVRWIADLTEPLSPEGAEQARAALRELDDDLPAELIEGQRTMPHILGDAAPSTGERP